MSEQLGQRFIEPQVDSDTVLVLLLYIMLLFMKYPNLCWSHLKDFKRSKTSMQTIVIVIASCHLNVFALVQTSAMTHRIPVVASKVTE